MFSLGNISVREPQWTTGGAYVHSQGMITGLIDTYNGEDFASRLGSGKGL